MRPRRPLSGRQEEIARVGSKARAGGGALQNQIQRLPGGGLPKNGPMPGGQSLQTGIGQRRAAPGIELGGQLQRRVKSGAIDQAQAEQTARQRQTFKAAFGPDWRAKVYGDRGYAQRTRTALAKNPDNPQVAALNKQLMARRQQMLEAARAKSPGNAGQGAPTRRRRRRAQAGGY